MQQEHVYSVINVKRVAKNDEKPSNIPVHPVIRLCKTTPDRLSHRKALIVLFI